MGFVGDHDDVAAVGQQRMFVALSVGEELLDGGENHATRFDAELDAKVGTTLSLSRWLAEQVLAAGKRAE